MDFSIVLVWLNANIYFSLLSSELLEVEQLLLNSNSAFDR